MIPLDETFDDAIEDAIDAASDFLKAGDRSAAHVVAGIAVTVGFALLATAIASGAFKSKPALRDGRNRAAPLVDKPQGAFSLVLPAVFSATTLSAVRVWNAPSTTERSRAMGLWFAAQTVNAIWLGLRPSSLRSQLIAAMSSAGLAAAFAHEARKIDDQVDRIAAPASVGAQIANFFGRKMDRPDDRPGPTVH